MTRASAAIPTHPDRVAKRDAERGGVASPIGAAFQLPRVDANDWHENTQIALGSGLTPDRATNSLLTTCRHIARRRPAKSAPRSQIH
jgi:hypothetical protein